MEGVSRIIFFFELGKAEAGIVVDGLRGEGVEASGRLGKLIDKFSEIVPRDAAAVEHSREVIVIYSPDKANVGVRGTNGDGAVHTIATGHEITKLAGSDKGIPAGEGVSATEINEEDTIIGLLGGEFLQPGDEAAGGIFVAGLGEGVHFINLV